MAEIDFVEIAIPVGLTVELTFEEKSIDFSYCSARCHRALGFPQNSNLGTRPQKHYLSPRSRLHGSQFWSTWLHQNQHEDLTGLDFFSNIPDEIEEIIES